MTRLPTNLTTIGACIGLAISATMFTANAVGLIRPMPRNLALMLIIGTTATGAAVGRFGDLRFHSASNPRTTPSCFSAESSDLMLYQQSCRSTLLHLNTLEPGSSKYEQTLLSVAVLLANARVGLANEWQPTVLDPNLTQVDAHDLPKPSDRNDQQNSSSAESRSTDATDPNYSTWLDAPEQTSHIALDRNPASRTHCDDRSIEFITR